MTAAALLFDQTFKFDPEWFLGIHQHWKCPKVVHNPDSWWLLLLRRRCLPFAQLPHHLRRQLLRMRPRQQRAWAWWQSWVPRWSNVKGQWGAGLAQFNKNALKTGRYVIIYYHKHYIYTYTYIICRLHITCRFYKFILYTLYMISIYIHKNIYIYIYILTSIWAPSLSFDLEPRLFVVSFFLGSEADEIQRFWVLRLWTTRFTVSAKKRGVEGMHFL